MPRTGTSRYQYVTIEGDGYVLDLMYDHLWKVNEESGAVQRHPVLFSEYRQRGILTFPAAPEAATRIFRDFESVLDAESKFCLHWLREHGHGLVPDGVAEAMAADCGTSIGALRHKHRLIEIEDGQAQLLGIGDYHHSRRKLSYSLTAWEVCFWIARHSVESLKFDQQNTKGKLQLRQTIRAGNRVGGDLIPSRGSVETMTLLLCDAYGRVGCYVNATIFEGLLHRGFASFW